MKVEKVRIDELKPAAYNPRKWTKEDKKRLKESLQKFGFVDPVIANCNEKRKNIVIGGHFRLECAKELGYTEVPVVYIDIPDEQDERELNIRLNKNQGRWDYEKLAEILPAERLYEVGFSFKEIKIADFLRNNNVYALSNDIYYEPLGLDVTLEDAIKTEKADTLLKMIDNSNLNEREKHLLRYTAYRFTDIRFDYLAEIYAASENEELKRIFEELVLVIIDFEAAIKKGFCKIDEVLAEAALDE